MDKNISPLFLIKNFEVEYPQTLKKLKYEVDFPIFEKQVVLFTGRSGIGKSTLFLLLNGILSKIYSCKISGNIFYYNRNIFENIIEKYPEELEKKMGYLGQNPYTQIVNPKVIDELVFGMENHRFLKEEMNKNTVKFSNLFGLTQKLYDKTKTLSGGFCQRLNLASIVSYEPDIILLDEPVSFLDMNAAKSFYDTIKGLKGKKTIIIIEHLFEQILDIVDNVLIFENTEEGSPEKMISFFKGKEYSISKVSFENKIVQIEKERINVSFNNNFGVEKKDELYRLLNIKCKKSLKENIQKIIEEKIKRKINYKIKKTEKEKIKNNTEDKIENKIKKVTMEKTKKNIDDKIEDKIDENIKGKIEEKLEDNIKENVKENIKENIKDKIDENLEENIKEKIKEEKKEERKVKLKAESVYFRYNKSLEYIFENLNFEFESGQIIGIIGENGSGKSTFLQLVSKILKPEKGKVNIFYSDKKFEKSIKKSYKYISILFQNPESSFFFPLVKDEILHQIKKDKNIDKYLFELIHPDFFDIVQNFYRSSFTLSEGEKRRLGFIIQLLMNKPIRFYDEPTYAQDFKRVELMKEIIKYCQKQNTLQIIVSHDFDFLRTISDKVYLIKDRRLEILN